MSKNIQTKKTYFVTGSAPCRLRPPGRDEDLLSRQNTEREREKHKCTFWRSTALDPTNWSTGVTIWEKISAVTISVPNNPIARRGVEHKVRSFQGTKQKILNTIIRHGVLDSVWSAGAHEYVLTSWFEFVLSAQVSILFCFFYILFGVVHCSSRRLVSSPQRARRAMRKTEPATWREWWWDRQAIQAKPRKVTFALMLLLKQVSWTFSLCHSNRSLHIHFWIF